MDLVYYNGNILPKESVHISPDDRGFLFADGIYEVVRWYGRSFFDMEGHMLRLKRSLAEINLKWNEVDRFSLIAEKLISANGFGKLPSMVYLQVTRGAAKRTHYIPEIPPTVYAFAFTFIPDEESREKGVKTILKPDIRWSRCDIKSIALLPNTLSFNEAWTSGYKECIFMRDGFITEASHSNVFLVSRGILRTHPESNHILSGISRKNVLRMAREAGINVSETAFPEKALNEAEEAFITNTSAEITPVIEIGGITIGKGKPGPVTKLLQDGFNALTLVTRNS